MAPWSELDFCMQVYLDLLYTIGYLQKYGYFPLELCPNSGLRKFGNGTSSIAKHNVNNNWHWPDIDGTRQHGACQHGEQWTWRGAMYING